MSVVSWESIFIVALLWWSSGMTAASILYRRGHDGRHWLAICAIAGPLSLLLVVDQARFVEPQATPLTLTHADADADAGHGTTIVMPLVATGWVDNATLDPLGPIRRLAIAANVAFEHAGDGWDPVNATSAGALADARDRFDGLHVELVVLPGRLPDALVAWAAEHAPATIVTAREAHRPSTVARLARLAARHSGVALLVTDHAASPARVAG